jgi:serine/threonine protein phosphatase 1
LNFLEDSTVGPGWIRHGGGATLLSYGVNVRGVGIDPDEWETIQSDFRNKVSADHLTFYRSLELSIEIGGYIFVHAGVRPGVALDRQSEHDLLWIRDAFLRVPTPFDRIVVHGHTPAEQPFVDGRRIGVDTGAYATGVLSAVRLADSDQRFIQVKSR